MPAPSAWMVRISFLYLAAGFIAGAVMLSGLIVDVSLRVAHTEWLLVGFMLQLAFGVASWILPRTPKRKSATPVWAVLGLMNLGVVTASAGALLGQGNVLGLGRAIALAGAATFAVYIWPRVRSFKEKMVR